MNNAVPRFTGKTRITGKTAKIPERPKNSRETLIGALVKTFIEYNKKYWVRDVVYYLLYNFFFNCAFRYGHYRK